jgi:HK97 family phage major capsid protein
MATSEFYEERLRRRSDYKWAHNAAIEFAKVGEKLNLGDIAGKGKSELLTMRADMRRSLEKYKAKLDGTNPDEINEEQFRAIEAAGYLIDSVSNQLDLDEAAATAFGARNTSASTDSGFRILGKDDKFESPESRNHSGPRVGFGEFVKAMALGHQDNADIRAAMEEASIGGGGATVPDYLFTSLIDRMRAKAVCIKAGANTVSLETQKTSIARLTGDPTAGWRLENAAIAESAASFDRVTFTANSLAVLVKVSRELLEDSVNLNEALLNAFAQSMAITLDKAALVGSGTAPEPRGIWNTTGVNALTADALTYDLLLDGLLAMKTANANDPTAVAMTPAQWRTLQGLKDSTGQPLRPPVALETLPILSSTNMGANEAIMGDFGQLLIGVRSGLRIELLKERFADSHQYAFIAHLRADTQVAQPTAFVKIPTT